MHLRVEFTVEPFVEARPGPHVTAAIGAARDAGLVPDVGPFATAVEGTPAAVLPALRRVVEAAVDAGADRVVLVVSPCGSRRERAVSGPVVPELDQLIAAVEHELGGRLAELSREDKQRAVKRLDHRGAFELRRAADRVADALGVSRITVYNYLSKLQ